MPQKLTIVTITYNDPEGLERTLRSLRGLIASPLLWELVVVDSSPEKNKAAIEAFSAEKKLIHLPQPARGIYAAINAGWKATSGEYVWFLNGGDEAISREPVEAACAKLDSDPRLGLVSGAARLARGGEYLYTQPARAGLAPLLGINRVCQQQILYRRSLLEKLGGFNETYRLAADYDFHLRAYAAGVPQEKFEGDLVIYDRGGQSTDAEAVFGEFRRIQHTLEKKGELRFAAMHALVFALERLRVGCVSSLTRNPAGQWLRRQWHRWKRR